jgi:hypothetical protein
MFQYYNQISGQNKDYYVLDFGSQVFVRAIQNYVYAYTSSSTSILRHDLDGNGSKTFGLGISVTGMYIDDQQNIYIWGTLSGNGYLVKLDSNNTILWQKTFTANFVTNLSIDTSYNVYIIISPNYLLKYNSSGTLQWQEQIAVTSQSLTINGIINDNSNNIILTAGYSGSVSDGVNYLIKLDSSGSKLYEEIYIAILTYERFSRPKIDSSNNIYAIAGYNSIYDPIFLKFNSSCVLQNQYRYIINISGTAFQIQDFIEINDEFYITANSPGAATALIKIDTSGTISLKRQFTATTSGNLWQSIRFDVNGNFHFIGDNSYEYCIPGILSTETKTFSSFNFTLSDITSITRETGTSYDTYSGTATTISTSSISQSSSSLSITSPSAITYTRYDLTY